MSVMLVIIVIFPTLASGSIASQVAKRRETVPNWAPDFNMHHDSISIEEDLGPTLLMEESEEDIPPAAVRDKVLVGHHRSPRNDQPLPRDKPTQVVVKNLAISHNDPKHVQDGAEILPQIAAPKPTTTPSPAQKSPGFETPDAMYNRLFKICFSGCVGSVEFTSTYCTRARKNCEVMVRQEANLYLEHQKEELKRNVSTGILPQNGAVGIGVPNDALGLHLISLIGAAYLVLHYGLLV